MDKTWIYVYRDTIENHNEDDNLSRILVKMEFAEKYYNEHMKNFGYDDFDDFLRFYVADDVMDFYEYAKKHNAILKIEDLK